jgi:hypothetical protein
MVDQQDRLCGDSILLSLMKRKLPLFRAELELDRLECRERQPLLSIALTSGEKSHADGCFCSPCHRAPTVQASIVRKQKNELVWKYFGCMGFEARASAGNIDHHA